MTTKTLTLEKFNSLTPRQRGYAVYMCGSLPEQPNVTDEKNPYPVGSHEAEEWDRGQQIAVLEVQDSEE